MKKMIFGFIALFSVAFAQEPVIDQTSAFIGAFSSGVFQKAIEICKEKEYKYFLVKEFSYKDAHGQTMEIHGATQAQGGELVKDSYIESSFGSYGDIQIDLEIIGFREKPQDEKAVDVQRWLDLIKVYEQTPEKVEGTKVTEIASLEELNEELQNANAPVFVDCYSKTCPPCKMLSPKYDTFSMELSTKGKFLKVDLAAVREIGTTYEVLRVPTLLVFEDGKLKETKEGLPDITSFFEAMKD